MKITMLKGLAILQALLALVGYFVAGGGWTSASVAIAAALAMILLSGEAVNDERIEHLKLKATKLGLGIGLIVTMLMNLFTEMLGKILRLPPLSAFDSLIVIMAIALVAFHYWCWQDGRGFSGQEKAPRP